MQKEEIKEILKNYLPEEALNGIADIMLNNIIHLTISKPRNTKTGDYRPPTTKRQYHSISINRNLTKHEFLIVFLHELAHLNIWNKYKNNVQPHGWQWKEEFQHLLINYIKMNAFPPEIEKALLYNFMKSNMATLHNCIELQKALKIYSPKSSTLYVEDLPDNACFMLNNGHTFKIISKMRKRYKCQSMINGRLYSVAPLAEVSAKL